MLGEHVEDFQEYIGGFPFLIDLAVVMCLGIWVFSGVFDVLTGCGEICYNLKWKKS